MKRIENRETKLKAALEAFNRAQAFFNEQKFVAAERSISEYQSIISYEWFDRTDYRNNQDVDISVVIVTYYGNQGLLEALEALQNQNTENFEIIVVDNGNNSEIQRQIPRRNLLHIVCPQNMILSEGRNIGSGFARGRILAFLDDDAIASENYIKSLRNAFDTYAIAGLRGKVLPKEQVHRHVGINHYNLGAKPMPFMINTEGNSAFRKTVYQALGGMNPLLFGHEGWALSYKIVRKYGINSLIYWPETVVYHDYANSNQKEGRKNNRHHLMNVYISKRYPKARSYRKHVKSQIGKGDKKSKRRIPPVKQRNHASVAYVHTGYWPSNSPSTTFVTYNAMGLADVFRSCYLIVQNDSSEDTRIRFEKHFAEDKPQNLHISNIKSVFSRWSKRIVYKRMARNVERLLKENRIRAIITRRETLLPYLVPLQEKYHSPVLYESHDFFADLSQRDDVNVRKRKRSQKLERTYIPKTAGVICLQPSQQKLYQSIFPNHRIFLAPTGLQNVHKPDLSNRKYITYIGSLEPHKGIETLLKAVSGLKMTLPLLFIGGKSQNEINRFSAFVKTYIPEGAFRVTGWLDKKALGAFLKETLLGVLPLQPTFFNRYLTSPLKLFDYYSYSVPVLASDLPTTRALIEANKTGLFFDPGNEESLAEQLSLFLNDDDMQSRMPQAVYAFAGQFLWSNRARRLKKIVRDVEIL